eukprot:TRINITY_DN1756_c0_g1_i6.p1 TRINITY_DN1756_c0_g1~~TRINITY_DN1756_c0_g1_i6.p1  ORF type:complete len:265 (-),score=41.78 TRINITY_DN1756_c0_g1_i6:24-818(-)
MPQDTNFVLNFQDSTQKIGKLLQEPIFTFSGHKSEGFAIDWSPTFAGRFFFFFHQQVRILSGDCLSRIHLWNPSNGKWAIDEESFKGHTSSVEDIQWSPSENNIFASCSADKTIKLWDIRTKKNCFLSVDAHDRDVNVLSWNKKISHLLASGSDDGSFKLWDLRKIKAKKAASNFRWHSNSISSIEWQPNHESILAVSSHNQVTLWDMSREEQTETGKNEEYPSQLMMLHQELKDVKELHWHKQIPGAIVTTSSRGFNVFKIHI